MSGKAPVRRGLSLSVSFLLLAVLGLASDIEAQRKWKSPFEGEKWGPFRGQLIDVETGQPIAGAVILVVWWEAVFTPIQTNREFYDAREAVTDADGRFEVPRYAPPFFTFRFFRPDIIYFAPGYAAHSEVVTPPDGEPFVDPTVIQLRRLKTREERIKSLPSRPSIPVEKMPQFIRAMNVERLAVGFSPYPIPGEAK